jgi:hypothetical protein
MPAICLLNTAFHTNASIVLGTFAKSNFKDGSRSRRPGPFHMPATNQTPGIISIQAFQSDFLYYMRCIFFLDWLATILTQA